MIFLQFSEITYEHISGKWKTLSVTLSPRAEDFVFKSLREISFLPDYNIIAVTETKLVGKWRLEYHNTVIPNPVIYFDFLDHIKAERAMITRYAFMPPEYGEKKNDEMILYFSNGSEIVLEKIA